MANAKMCDRCGEVYPAERVRSRYSFRVGLDYQCQRTTGTGRLEDCWLDVNVEIAGKFLGVAIKAAGDQRGPAAEICEACAKVLALDAIKRPM